jgi:hypothetical protein
MLPALLGLAKQFRKENAGTYLAGLWEAGLPLCLLWEAHAAKASPYRAPSWSWASMDTSISGGCLITESTFYSKAFFLTIFLATVKAVSCTTGSTDPTGRVTGGNLTIAGKVLNIIGRARGDHDEHTNTHQMHDWDARIAPPPRPHQNWTAKGQVQDFIFGFTADYPLAHCIDLACLLIGEIPTSRAPRALILQKLPFQIKGESYERVGLIDRVVFESSVRSNDWMFLFNNAATKTITIV